MKNLVNWSDITEVGIDDSRINYLKASNIVNYPVN